MGLSDLVGAVTGIAKVFTNLGNLIEFLIMGLFELLPAFFSLFNPINIVNDSITGVILAIKVVIVGIIDGLKPKGSSTDKCSDTGGGLFGFRKTGNGAKLSKCGPGRNCVSNRWLIFLIAVICPPLANMHLGITGFFSDINSKFPYSIYVLFLINLCSFTHSQIIFNNLINKIVNYIRYIHEC